MQASEAQMGELFEGLKLLADTAFPKQCGDCGRVYDDLQALLSQTQAVDTNTGLRAAESGSNVTLSRRCGCGAIIEEYCDDRRAQDALGLKRREIFDRLLQLLTDGGMDYEIAKAELLKVMRGGSSDLLSKDQLTRFFS